MNEKYIRKIRGTVVRKTRKTKIYPYLYSSYWNTKFSTNKNDDTSDIYFAARPNPGAGIGHQMANWIAGFWFAKYFNLKFAHIPFSNPKWESFLGFGKNEVTVEELKNKGYKVKRIPRFDEDNEAEIERTREIISSYAGKKVVLLAEQDQFYHDQFGVMDELKAKFNNADARKNDNLIYNPEDFNIAIHVRRGDIVQNGGKENPNLTMRFQSNDYFVNALDTALEYLKDKENIKIFFFSQGKPEDYPEFNKYSNLNFCLDMGAQDSFLHMVKADAIITSKSSFSYKPALLNDGIKFCPKNFWHGYPDNENWILLDENGEIAKDE